MSMNLSLTSSVVDALQPSRIGSSLPAHLEQMIAARWKWWAPWVRLELLRRPDYDPAVASAESARFRQLHSQHIVAMLRAGITMRLVRRHRLDDPRITEDMRAVLVRAVMERQRKARTSRPVDLARLINLAAFGPVPLISEVANVVLQRGEEYLQPYSQRRDLTEPQERQRMIDSIRRHISEQFHLAEMRDPDLKARTHRRVYVLPRQLAMYIVRQVTGASLEEIGREFGDRHHTTVMHSVKKIQELRRSDNDVDRTITRLTDTLQR